MKVKMCVTQFSAPSTQALQSYVPLNNVLQKSKHMGSSNKGHILSFATILSSFTLKTFILQNMYMFLLCFKVPGKNGLTRRKMS